MSPAAAASSPPPEELLPAVGPRLSGADIQRAVDAILAHPDRRASAQAALHPRFSASYPRLFDMALGAAGSPEREAQLRAILPVMLAQLAQLDRRSTTPTRAHQQVQRELNRHYVDPVYARLESERAAGADEEDEAATPVVAVAFDATAAGAADAATASQ